jgi:hypothetical protein
VHDACLEDDLDVLPNGDMTEVGERVRGGPILFLVRGSVDEYDMLAGYITLRRSETTCQYLSRHLLWIGHSGIRCE